MTNLNQLLHKISCLEKQIKSCCEGNNPDISILQQDILNLQNQIPAFLADDQNATEVFTTQVIFGYPIGTSVQDILLGIAHPAVSLTNNNAPFSFNTTTQTGNIPKSGSLVDNLDGTYTFTAGDGSLPVSFTKLGLAISDTFSVNTGNTVTLSNTVNPNTSFLVFRNGNFTKDYTIVGSSLIFNLPFGNSTGGTGNETINVEYYTV